jgi:hypothetical protein
MHARSVTAVHALQLRRAVAKILDARQKGLVRLLNKAVVLETKTAIPPNLARAFQHSTRYEEGDRLFLEVCTHAGTRRCLSHHP